MEEREELMTTPRDGALRIAGERERQIENKGYTREHDLAHHTTEELLDAAWCYFAQAEALIGSRPGFSHRVPYSWPWDSSGWNPAATSTRNLEKAGALIAAAIDRRIAEGLCPARVDATHCNHWWDDDGPCCSCGDDTANPARETEGSPENEGPSLGNIIGYRGPSRAEGEEPVPADLQRERDMTEESEEILRAAEEEEENR